MVIPGSPGFNYGHQRSPHSQPESLRDTWSHPRITWGLLGSSQGHPGVRKGYPRSPRVAWGLQGSFWGHLRSPWITLDHLWINRSHPRVICGHPGVTVTCGHPRIDWGSSQGHLGSARSAMVKFQVFPVAPDLVRER